MKKLDKFSILAIAFTAFYLLIGKFIMSDIYHSIPYYLSQTIFYIYLACMASSATVGVVGIIRTYKLEHKIRWGLLLFSLFNTCVIITNLAITLFPKVFLKYFE